MELRDIFSSQVIHHFHTFMSHIIRGHVDSSSGKDLNDMVTICCMVKQKIGRHTYVTGHGTQMAQ